ncbi:MULTISPECIES: ATPase, T2SS/T4P/T4SS family [unclassified Burkholderia]|uniref:ATPase, T2SS/T4P/T4SS family n=1 Tax=unclassified Burkholderia TaxID=2613784 RepID=UPI002AAF1FAB|nr:MULTISPECIES: ATPase, T2SS/T4P/T4SS family [unclassified Burkholderia]
MSATTPLPMTFSRPDPMSLSSDFVKSELDTLLTSYWENKVSDITLQSGEPVWIEYKRQLYPGTNRYLDDFEVMRALVFMYGPTAEGVLGTGVDLNVAYEIYRQRGQSYRFRLNAVKSRIGDIGNGLSITLRTIPHNPPKIETLNLPVEILDNLFQRYGMVLIVGTTGSGKTTLLASHVRYRIEVRCAFEKIKILEYGEPIEFTYGGLGDGSMPAPSQVEIGPGQHLRDFSMATPNAMRRASKVIIVGEMRDADSMEEGMQMAQTGHAVYATMHVDTPAEAFDRVLSYYQGREAGAANKMMSNLRMIVAQKLAVTSDGEVKAYRSWLVLNRELRIEMSRIPYYEWAGRVRELCRANGSDFETQAAPDVLSGTLSFDGFKEVTGMAHAEAERFMDAYRKRAQSQNSSNDPLRDGKEAA